MQIKAVKADMKKTIPSIKAILLRDGRRELRIL